MARRKREQVNNSDITSFNSLEQIGHEFYKKTELHKKWYGAKTGKQLMSRKLFIQASVVCLTNFHFYSTLGRLRKKLGRRWEQNQPCQWEFV